MSDHVPAGDFATWLTEMQRALRGEHDSDVPCGSCTGCCTSSQFIHIAPDETDTLAHVPAELLFPAPRMPRGHVLMGYDQRGHCPMLIDGQCSIYEHRPRTCRTYDCRVFAAAGLQVDDDKPAIADRSSRWQFDHPTTADRVRHDAVAAAAQYLACHRDELTDATVPSNPTQLAVLAIEVHQAFVDDHTPALQAVAVELRRVADAAEAVRPRARPRRRSGPQSGPPATSRPSTPADRADRA